MDPLQEVLVWVEGNASLVYAILFLYCSAKSGALPFFAGLATSTGSLDIVAVFFATFLGGYLGDEVRFTVARRYGHKLVFKSARLRRGLKIAIAMMEKYGPGYIFLYRYPKGMRTIGALPVGLSSMAWRWFTILNAGSALLWAVVLVGAGYLFGSQIGDIVENGWGTATVLLLAMMVAITWLAYGREKAVILDT